MTLLAPDPIELTTGGGHAPEAAGDDRTEEIYGPLPEGETIFFPRDDISPPTFTPDGAEIAQETSLAVSPLAVEFSAFRYTISECGKYEVIGDLRILREKGTQRVLGVLPELWSLLSQE